MSSIDKTLHIEVVTDKEDRMSKEPLAYTRRWLYVLPEQEAGAQPIPRMRDDEEDLAVRRLSAAKPITAKAVPELKPKTLLTQNLTRADLISWERRCHISKRATSTYAQLMFRSVIRRRKCTQPQPGT